MGGRGLAGLTVALACLGAAPTAALGQATNTIRTVAGNGNTRSDGGGVAVDHAVVEPSGIAIFGNRGFLVAEWREGRVLLVTPEGRGETVAGSLDHTAPPVPDGGSAKAGSLDQPTDVSVTADGSILIAEFNAGRIRRVAPDGTISTVASGLAGPRAVAATADGGFLVAEQEAGAITHVAADGTAKRVMGTGSRGGSFEDGRAATDTTIAQPVDVEPTPDGGFMVLDADPHNRRVFRVAADGIVTVLAGQNAEGSSGDGGPAKAASFADPRGIALTEDGGWLISDGNTVRRVAPSGVIAKVAGRGDQGFSGDRGPALQAQLSRPSGIAATNDGGYLVSDPGNARVRYVDADYRAPIPPAVAKTTPSTVLGNGDRPDAIVDQYGTAHVVWNEVGGIQSPPDTLVYCQLPRGASACSSVRRLVPNPGADYNAEQAGPQVLQTGPHEIVVLTNRYPAGYESHSNNTFMFVSTDRGASFRDPVRISGFTNSGGAIVFDRRFPTIGLISETVTGGTFFQAVEPLTPSPDAQPTNLAEGIKDGAYAGDLAVVNDTTPIAVFEDLHGQSYWRKWNEQGGYNDQTQWTPAQKLSGAEPQIASEQDGNAFLLSQTGAYAESRLWLQRFQNGGFGRRVPVSPKGIGGDRHSRDVYVDPDGGVHVAYRDASHAESLAYRSSLDGKRFSAPTILAKAPPNGKRIQNVTIAAAVDGGGFVLSSDELVGSNAPIRLKGIGTKKRLTGRAYEGPIGIYSQTTGGGAATGPGAPGGGSDRGCATVTFGPVEALTKNGCFHQRPDSSVAVTGQEISLNGLRIVPQAGAEIAVDTKKRSFKSFGSVQVFAGPVKLFEGRLDVELSNGGSVKLADFDLDKVGARLFGFKLPGSASVELRGKQAVIPIHVNLGEMFGGVSGDARLVLDNRQGLHLEALKVSADHAFLGPIEASDVLIEYDAAEQKWHGAAKLGLPPRPIAPTLAADVTFQGGDFVHGAFGLDFGASAPTLFPGVFLQEIRFEIGVKPLLFGGGITLTVGKRVGGAAAPVEVDGDFRFTFHDAPLPSVLEIGLREKPITLRLFGISVAQARLEYRTNGYIEVDAKVELGKKPYLYVGAGFNGWFDAPSERFNLKASADICAVGFCPLLNGTAVASSKGIAACATVPGIGTVFNAIEPGSGQVGAGYSWKEKKLRGLAPCAVEDYEEQKPPPVTARASQTSSTTVRLDGGVPTNTIVATGAEAPPRITVVSPSGERFETPADGAQADSKRYYVLRDPEARQTYIVIVGKAVRAGAWKVETQPGSSPVTVLETAAGVRRPKIAAKVSGRGAARRLSYSASRASGRTITFTEEGKGVAKPIGQATKTRGAFRFRSADGPKGRRSIVAIVEQNGRVLETRKVASYLAPGPVAPARPRGLRVTRRGQRAVVRWGSSTGATRYVVRARLSDGRSLLFFTSPRRRTVVIPGVGRSVRGTITVQGRAASGQLGRKAAARLGVRRKRR